MKVIAIEIIQNGKKLYETAFTAEELLKDIFKVDYWAKDNKNGYQRKPTTARIKAFAKFITTGKTSPVSVTLSLRAKDVETKEIYKIDRYRRIVEIEIDDNLWIIDGQHRIAGIRKLLEDQENKYATFTVPAIIVLTGDKGNIEEAEQFVIINKTQKAVKTDLAEQYLLRLKESKTDLHVIKNLPSVITRKIDWKPTAIKIAEILADGKVQSPWANQIIFPNEDTQERRGKIASITSFTDSLKPILTSNTFKGYNAEELAKIIAEYWNAIEELCPDAFNNPEEYVIQKTTGMYSLHGVLEVVLIAAGGAKKEDIKKVLNKVTIDINGRNNKIFKSEMWERDGYFGKLGTSQKAFRLIIDTIISAIHRINSIKQSLRPFEVPK